tara:strand:+ start:349 stop:2118 length:1770 start_codon:yes stop_codon:yes gene_type:complete
MKSSNGVFGNNNIIKIDQNKSYDAVLLKSIIDYIIIPEIYYKSTTKKHDYLFELVKENIKNSYLKIRKEYKNYKNKEFNYNNEIKKYELEFINKLKIIYNLSIVEPLIYNDYNKIKTLLPNIKHQILCNFMSTIYRTHSNTWKNIIHPDTLLNILQNNKNEELYLKYNNIYELESENELFINSLHIENKKPSYYAVIYIGNYINDYLYYGKKFKNYDKLLNKNIIEKYNINININELIQSNNQKYYENYINYDNITSITFIDLISNNNNRINQLINLIFLIWSGNKELQNSNPSIFYNEYCSQMCSLYKLWFINSYIHSIKKFNKTIRFVAVLENIIEYKCENLNNNNNNICAFNINEKNICKNCIINESKFYITDSKQIRLFYNPFLNIWENVYKLKCYNFNSTEIFKIKYNIILDILKQNNSTLLYNNKIYEYINYNIKNKKHINICNKIGYCDNNNINYIVLPENEIGFKNFVEITKYTLNTNQKINKRVLKECIKHKYYCISCAVLVLSHYLKNSKLFNIKEEELYILLVKHGYKIQNLNNIKTYVIIFNNDELINKKNYININLNLIDHKLKKTTNSTKYIIKE